MENVRKFKCQGCGWEKIIDNKCEMCKGKTACDFKNPTCPECGHVNDENSITNVSA